MHTLELLKEIQSSETIISDSAQRFPEAASDMDFFRQGDIYIWKREKTRGLVDCDKIDTNLQLAPGSTKGSRHILDSGDGVTMYRVGGDVLQGPLLVLTKERTITHPEHGNVILPPGCYEITYQLAYAEERRRVLD